MLFSDSLKVSVVASLVLGLSACGGSGSNGSSTGQGGNDGASTNQPEIVEPPSSSDIPLLVPRATIGVDNGSRIVDATLSPSGTEVAVLSFTQMLNTLVFGDQYSLEVFDTVTGALVQTMADPGEVNQVLDLYWGDDRLTLLLDRGAVVWDPGSGNVLDIRDGSGEAHCDSLSPVEAFNSATNVLYAGEVFGLPNICVLNLSTGMANYYQVVKPATATRISSMALDSTASRLSISFANDSLRADSTQVYDALSIAPIGSALSASLGEVLSVGDGFELYQDELEIIMQPTGAVVEGFDQDAAVSPNGEVFAVNGSDSLTLVALPALLYIGETEKDNASLRSFSVDGSVGAFVIGESVQIYELSGRSSVSAVKPPVTFARQFSGTMTVDGVDEVVNGTCDTVFEANLGANQLDVEASSDSGDHLYVRAQNLLKFVSYRYTVDDLAYVHSTVLAQNFSLERPQITTDGINITGSTDLYTFSTTEFFELVADASTSSGYQTRSLILSGVCAE
ncbi:MAG: hypothetical protein V3U76_00890 [Granulosicoccus sp.]